MAEPKPAERESGVYYVTIRGKDVHTIGVWGPIHLGDKDNHWTVPGIREVLEDYDLIEIGERVGKNP